MFCYIKEFYEKPSCLGYDTILENSDILGQLATSMFR